jgi:hypothetical protein
MTAPEQHISNLTAPILLARSQPGYEPTPDYSVKITATDGEGQPTDIAVLSRNGQIRTNLLSFYEPTTLSR